MGKSETGKILLGKIIAGGWSWSHIVKRGTAVQLTDIEGGANVSALFYSAANVTERYNMGDTLKIQHISFLCKNRCIYSDMGRILMSITDDTCGWHDVICGVSDAGLIERRFGKKSYQDFRNSFYRNGYDSLLVELAKYGMGRRDFTEVVNFFSKVGVDAEGNLSFVESSSRAGDFVQLRAEMDTLLVIDTGMHPLNPAPSYQTKPVQVTLSTCPAALADDPCRTFCPENERGFINTTHYHL